MNNIIKELKGLNEYERIALIKSKSNFYETTVIGRRTTYSYKFIEIYHTLKLYRTGTTGSTYSTPSGLIDIETTNLKELKELEQRLKTYGFQDIDYLKEALSND